MLRFGSLGSIREVLSEPRNYTVRSHSHCRKRARIADVCRAPRPYLELLTPLCEVRRAPCERPLPSSESRARKAMLGVAQLS